MDTSLKKGESATLLFMYPGMALKLTQCGPANDFLQRRNGKKRPGGQKGRSTPGEMSLMVPYAIPKRAASEEPLKWTNSQKGEAPLDVSTWREMSMNGLMVGTEKRGNGGSCGAVRGAASGASPAVRAASGSAWRAGTASTGFVAPGLSSSPLFF